MKKLIVITLLCIAMCLCVTPTFARTITNSGATIYIGEEHLNMKFVEESETKMFGWWKSGNINIIAPSKVINLGGGYDDVSFPASEFEGYDGYWREIDENYNLNIKNNSILYFALVMPQTPTPTPTPIPTPSEGNLVISSSPSDATVYVDNVIKGITPLTIQEKNGEHVVKIRLYGYQEYTTTVVVNGEDVSINPMLIPLTTVATTVATTIPTTVPTTIPTTIVTTIPTTESTVEPTIEPTMEITGLEQPVTNDDAIAAIQSQIDEQATKNAEQDAVIAEQSEQIDVLTQIINFILSFLGVK